MKRTFVRSVSILWRSFASVILLCLFIFFLYQQQDELGQLPKVVEDARGWYVVLGASVAGLFAALQGVTYQACLRTMGKFIPARLAIQLYIKRFFVGTFLPAGFSVSQYAYSKELTKHDINEYESHLASTLYLVVGSAAYLVVLVPTLLYLLLSGVLTQAQSYAGALVVTGMVLVIIEFIRFFSKRGIMYWMFNRVLDDVPAFIDTWKKHEYDIVALRQSFVFSLGTQFLGVLLLAISLTAFGVNEAIFLALLAYVVAMVVLTLSPVFQGIGLVEFSMVYILTQFGVGDSIALAVTLLFRIFQLWLPLLIGGGLILLTRILRFKNK